MDRTRKKRRTFCGKAEANRKHAKRRAMQRYCVGEKKIKKIVEAITNNEIEKIRTLERQSSNRILKAVRLEKEGTTYFVVYDRQRHVIITFLPVNKRLLHMAQVAFRVPEAQRNP